MATVYQTPPKKYIVCELAWVIMDHEEGLIARGTTKNRYLCMVDVTQDTNRILTYPNRVLCERGYIEGKFDLRTPAVGRYIKETYGVTAKEFLESRSVFLKAVEAELTLEKW